MRVDRNGWEWMEVGGSGWEWNRVDGSGCEWIGVGASGCEWMRWGGSTVQHSSFFPVNFNEISSGNQISVNFYFEILVEFYGYV